MALDYAKDNGYQEVIANCKKTNELSHKVFNESGFKEFEMDMDEYLSIGIEENDIPKNVALKYKF